MDGIELASPYMQRISQSITGNWRPYVHYSRCFHTPRKWDLRGRKQQIHATKDNSKVQGICVQIFVIWVDDLDKLSAVGGGSHFDVSAVPGCGEIARALPGLPRVWVWVIFHEAEKDLLNSY